MSPEDAGFLNKIRSKLTPEPKRDTGNAITKSVGVLVDPTSGKVHSGDPAPALGSAFPSPPLETEEEPKARGCAEIKVAGYGDPNDSSGKVKGPKLTR